MTLWLSEIINSLWHTLFSLFMIIKKSKSIREKDKRPNLYNKKILVFRHSDSLRFSLVCDTHYISLSLIMKKEKCVAHSDFNCIMMIIIVKWFTHSDLITFDS